MLVLETFPAITQKRHLPPRSLQQYLFDILDNSKNVRKTTQIHTYIIINGYTHKNFIIVKLLQSYISSGYLHQAHQAFEQIKNPSTTSWNQIIRGYAGTDTPHESIHLYDKMQASNVVPDEYTYSCVISACARGNLLRMGEKFHGRVLAIGFGSNLFVQTNLVNLYTVYGVKQARKVFDEMREKNVVTWNTLLAGYVKCRDLDGACKVFDEMPERNIVSWTIMISGFASNGGCKEALSLFREMTRDHMELDQLTLMAALSACAEIGDLNMGRLIHSYIDRTWHITNNKRKIPLNNALIHMYTSCGVIADAFELFKRMPVKTTISWTTMISGFAKQGRGKDALSVFQLMQKTNTYDAKPDTITMLMVLYACSHAGLVDEGRYFFKNMNPIWGIEPEIEHYGCMVDLLSRAGLLNEAHELVESMPMEPNDAIWGALLGGCRIHKNAELASQIARKLASMDLENDKAFGYLVLLSNVYAGDKRWKDVVSVREKMVQLAVRKSPGRSWIKIGVLVHEFLAGDRTHKHASSIYEILQLVISETMFAGYKPDVYEAAQPYVWG